MVFSFQHYLSFVERFVENMLSRKCLMFNTSFIIFNNSTKIRGVLRALKNLSKSKPNNKNSGAATPLCCDPAFIRNFQKYLKNSPNNASQTYI